MKKLWEILVPTMIDRGEGVRPVKTRYHKIWDEKVRKVSGGLTVLSPTKGHWISPENVLFTAPMKMAKKCVFHRHVKIIAARRVAASTLAVLAQVVRRITFENNTHI